MWDKTALSDGSPQDLGQRGMLLVSTYRACTGRGSSGTRRYTKVSPSASNDPFDAVLWSLVEIVAGAGATHETLLSERMPVGMRTTGRCTVCARWLAHGFLRPPQPPAWL